MSKKNKTRYFSSEVCSSAEDNFMTNTKENNYDDLLSSYSCWSVDKKPVRVICYDMGEEICDRKWSSSYQSTYYKRERPPLSLMTYGTLNLCWAKVKSLNHTTTAFWPDLDHFKLISRLKLSSTYTGPVKFSKSHKNVLWKRARRTTSLFGVSRKTEKAGEK